MEAGLHIEKHEIEQQQNLNHVRRENRVARDVESTLLRRELSVAVGPEIKANHPRSRNGHDVVGVQSLKLTTSFNLRHHPQLGEHREDVHVKSQGPEGVEERAIVESRVQHQRKNEASAEQVADVEGIELLLIRVAVFAEDKVEQEENGDEAHEVGQLVES